MCESLKEEGYAGEEREEEMEGRGISVVSLSRMPNLTPDTNPPRMACFLLSLLLSGQTDLWKNGMY